jgi:hypothetical protein
MKALGWDPKFTPEKRLKDFEKQFQALKNSEPSFAAIAARNAAVSAPVMMSQLPMPREEKKAQIVSPVVKSEAREIIAEETQSAPAPIEEEKQEVPESSAPSKGKTRNRAGKRLQGKAELRQEILGAQRALLEQVCELLKSVPVEEAIKLRSMQERLNTLISNLENQDMNFSSKDLKDNQALLARRQKYIELIKNKRSKENNSVWNYLFG